MQSLTLFTAPVSEPLTLGEVRSHLRIDGAEDDVLLLSLIRAARQHVEEMSSRALLTQTWELTLDYFPGYRASADCWDSPLSAITLPRPILQSVSSVKYVDTNGTLQTLAITDYQVLSKSEPARIVPAYGLYWPPTRYQPEAVTVRYIAGWTTAALVPQPIKQAMLLLIGHWFENREAVSLERSVAIVVPMAVGALLFPYKILEAA